MDRSADHDLDEDFYEPVRPHPPGTSLSKDLTITGILGEGGTAIVYAAQHRVLEREVAVKVSVGASSDSNLRLVREAKMCASVRDPHIPRIFGLEYLEDGTPYLIMEKIEGSVLTQTLARFRIPVRIACDLASELLEALDAVHFAGLIHRDVKPSNLIIDLRPSAPVHLHLLDFGVGKILRTDEIDLPELTCQGELLGTPLYMAPEQILTMPVDERADLYATAVVLYEMLAGRTPFQGDSIGEVFAAVLRDDVIPLCDLRPELPRALELLLLRAMDRNPDARFQSAHAMRVALLAASQEVQQLGFPDAFEAKTCLPELVSNDVATIRMSFHLDPSELSELERSSVEPEPAEDDRASGARLRAQREHTLSFAQALPFAKLQE